MTRLEKAHELKPELDKSYIQRKFCPREILGDRFPSAMGCNYDGGNPEVCEKCWNEPYKEVNAEKGA